MKFLLLLILISGSFVSSKAQTFFVSGSDKYSVNKVTEKVRFEGYKIVDSAAADYIVNLLIDGKYNAMSLKRGFKGYITITDRITGSDVAKSDIQKGNPTLYNGYNASYAIFSKLEKKFLPDALKNCPKKEVATK